MKNRTKQEIHKAYEDYLEHLKKEHPRIYRQNKELLEEQLGIV
jgi:uncharacterized short protein YbdD (DUF466 family)